MPFPLLLVVLTAGPKVPPAYAQMELPVSPAWSRGKAELGARLFHEKRLSKDSSVSCATCHDPAYAFAEPRAVSTGVGGAQGTRNAPAIINRAFGSHQFWDGRAGSLEEQATGPMENPIEMALPLTEVAKRLASDKSYVKAFRRVFGHGPTAKAAAEALAAYERTIFSVDTPFDRFFAGDTQALSESAARGLQLFGGRAKCSACHSGLNFTDERFHVLGVGKDEGRAAVTQAEKDKGAFRTPTLRELSRTAPYMHDGSLPTLRAVIDFYERGGEHHANLDEKMEKLSLSEQDKQDLEAFLQSLSGTVVDFRGPVLAESSTSKLTASPSPP